MILLAEHDEPTLAAKKKRQHGASSWPTSTPKNRVWGFENTPSGRPVVEPQLTQETAAGSVQYTYQIASGRAEWPVTYPYLSSYWSDFSANTGTSLGFTGRLAAAKPTSFPLPNSTANPLTTLLADRCLTPQEYLIGLCSTLDTAGAPATPNNYYFQRQDPDSPTNDWTNITRNQQLVNYLRNEMGQPMPGIGQSLASKWDAATSGDTDWIALNCFDFSRSLVNQYTFNPSDTTWGGVLYSYAGIAGDSLDLSTATGDHKLGAYIEPNAATVAPLHVSLNGNTYVTEGAYPALKEAAVMFYATSRVQPVPPTTASGAVDGTKVPFAGEWKNLISYVPGATPTGQSQTNAMQAVMFLSFAQMNPGYEYYMPVFWIKVTPVGGSFSVNGKTIDLPDTTHNSVQWNTWKSGSHNAQTYGPLFYKQFNQPKIFSNAPPTTPSSPGTIGSSSPTYYTLVSNSITMDPTQVSFSFGGTNVQVDVYAPYSNNLDIDPTADSNQLVSSQQIDFSSWSGMLPIPLAPRWNVCQQKMTLAADNKTITGVPMPDPANGSPTPPAVDPTPATPSPPEGWQVEVVPRVYPFATLSTALLSADGLGQVLPSYLGKSALTASGYAAGSTGYGALGGEMTYVYAGTVTPPAASVAPLVSSYSPALGANGISTDLRCRVAALEERSPYTSNVIQFMGETDGNPGDGASMDPFTATITGDQAQGYPLITPYDTVISMVSDPTSGAGKASGDPRLMGRGIYSAAGSATFVSIKTALAGSSPNHVIMTSPTQTTIGTMSQYGGNTWAVFPPRATDQAQWHQLGWPGPSGEVSGMGGSVPMDTGYLTVPTFGGGVTSANYLAIRGIGNNATGVLGSEDDPGTAVGVEANVTMSLDPNGDWTSMPGQSFDGGYVARPDQDYSALLQRTSSQPLMVPYFETYGTENASQSSTGVYTAASSSFFMPNRQIPSPVVLGTLPSDMKTGWQTLAFCPNPAKTMNGAGTHPGPGTPANLGSPAAAVSPPYTSPPDHLLLDLFWMPVAEPYPISSQFATAGKVNLNYAMMPFPYITRKTALDAVLKSVWLYAVPSSVAPYYKSFWHMTTQYPSQHTRYPIAVDQTLKAFDAKFSTGDIFRSASQICDMFLYPGDPTKNAPNNPLVTWDTNNANITSWWNGQQLTSDNGREEPYNAIYSRVTTKSNTYTVHWRVQALQKANRPGADPATWTEGTDVVGSELRGATLIERYLDPNATNIPDYATATSPLPLSNYYKWRVDSETYFQPSP